MYDPNDELIQSILGRQKRNNLSFGNSTVQNIGNVIGDLPHFGEAKRLRPSEDIATKIALLNYKQSLKPTDPVEGYGSESEIPKTMGGLPLEGVTTKGGRFVPSYKTPSSGMLGPDSPNFGDYNLEGEEYLNSLSPQQRETVKAIASYASDPNHEFAGLKGATQRAPYIEAARHYDHSYDPMEYKKRADYLKDFSSGKRSTNLLAGNTLIKHLGSLESSIQDTPSNGIRILEQGGRFAAKQAPSLFPKQAEAMTNEDTAINAVAGELSNVFKQTGGTDPEIKSWLDAYDRNAPHELKQAYIKKGVELLNGRISALGNEYEQTMGKPYGKPLINPEAQSVLDRVLFKNQFGDMKNSKTPSFVDGVGDQSLKVGGTFNGSKIKKVTRVS